MQIKEEAQPLPPAGQRLRAWWSLAALGGLDRGSTAFSEVKELSYPYFNIELSRKPMLVLNDFTRIGLPYYSSGCPAKIGSGDILGAMSASNGFYIHAYCPNRTFYSIITLFREMSRAAFIAIAG